MSEQLRVGSFTLARPLASGGMGEVWLGYHTTGDPVAVKIIRAARGKEEGVFEALQAEIRAVAALDHPHIVRVYDAGVVGEALSESSEGRFPVGSPWLAMEWARGTLQDVEAQLTWSQLKTALLQTLDGLAHAHARGLVHRDLKPANVLFVDSDEGRRYLLADFGLAYQLERAGKPMLDGGTMPFMAPEQWLNAWTEQGPWTDLYALGCMTFRLVGGKVPYRSRDPEAQRRSHLFSPIPDLVPRFSVPRPLVAWVHTCMAKDPQHRFQRAADAAWALLQLPEIDDPGEPGDPDAMDTHGRLTMTTRNSLPVDQWAGARSGEGPADGDIAHAPVPFSWRRPVEEDAIARGIGLIGLSEPPLVGRAEERDRLWQRLIDADRLGLVLLRGAAGVGKSRLARWLGERSHEVGAAEVFRARFDRVPGPGHGLSGLLEEHLRTHGMGGAEVLRHLKHALRSEGIKDPYEAKALAQILRPGDPVVGEHSMAGGDDRFEIVWRLMQRRAAGRRMVVWLDDAHLASEAIRFASWLLERAGEAPGLVVLTIREEALGADLRRSLDALTSRHGGDEVRLGALPDGTTAELVRATLPVDDDVASRVEKLAGGNPLFAVQLIGDLAEKGRLRGDFGGVSVDEAELPESLRAVWTAALEQLYATTDGSRSALEVAAILGSSFAHAEWSQVCRKRGTKLTPHLVSVIAQRGLLVSESSGGSRWSFVHDLLREAVAAECEAAGRAVRLHAACAEVMATRDHPFAARRAHHLERAGEADAAVDALLDALTWLAEWDRQRALEVAEHFERLLADQPDDPRWLDALRTLVGIHRLERSDAYPVVVQRLFDMGRRLQDRAAEAFALVELARIDTLALQLPRAEARAGLAVHLAARTDDRGLILRAQVGRAEIRRHRGERDVAESMLRDALELAQTPVEEQQVLIALSLVLAERGEGKEADRMLLDYADRHTLVQAPMFRARLQHARGRVLLAGGKSARAVAVLEEAVALRDRAGFRLPTLDLDLGFARAAAGMAAEARVVLEQALGRFPPDRDALHRVSCLAALAALDAAAGDFDAVEERQRMLEELPVQGVRHDAPRRLIEAGRDCKAAGRLPLARRLVGVARAQLAASGMLEGSSQP